MAKHLLETTTLIGTTISEWRENNNYIQTLFVGEACYDKQTSKNTKNSTASKNPREQN